MTKTLEQFGKESSIKVGDNLAISRRFINTAADTISLALIPFRER